jgi:hypothetical protein
VAGIFVTGWIVWTLAHSAAGVGKYCESNEDCISKLCLKESGRIVQYCSRRCADDGDCPDGWKCLATPDLAGRQVCIKP